MFLWKVPSANQALLISGGKRNSEGASFRVVVGHGAFVLPGFRKAGLLSLDVAEAVIQEDCITRQGISLGVTGVCVFKVGDDAGSIANAARRFLDQEHQMGALVGQVFGGHLRSVIGAVTVEQIIQDRAALAQQIRDSTSAEMEKMGLVVDSFQVKEIEDPSGYIISLAQPHVAAVQRDARIAQARADQDASKQEQDSAAQTAGYRRDSEIAQANAEAQTQEAKAQAAQARPLEEARAQQATITEQTRVAELDAGRKEAELTATVRKEADADAYGITVRAGAEAEANRVRAEALAGDALERIVATRIVEQLPDLVSAATAGLEGSNLTVFNGAEGVTDLLTKILGMGFAAYRASVAELTPVAAPAATAAVTPSAVPGAAGLEAGPPNRPAAGTAGPPNGPAAGTAGPSNGLAKLPPPPVQGPGGGSHQRR